jgi:regulator of CtrA degradation
VNSRLGALRRCRLRSYRNRTMTQPASINPRIVEGLYCEALVLSDEVRGAFELTGRLEDGAIDEDQLRVALSCEALRTTTRMMHAIAWLLNHRAYFMGELSEFQLRRHGRLANDFPPADPDRVALLSPEVRALIAATERFYARLVRLDRDWRRSAEVPAPSAIARLRERLGQSMHSST